MALRALDGEETGSVEAIVWILGPLLGSYAIADAAYPMNEYLSMAFGLAETGSGAWWLVRTAVAEAPLLFLLLVVVAAVIAARDGGVLACCVLTTALLQGMAMALFGVPSGFVEAIEPSFPAGIFTGVAGWALGVGYSVATGDVPDGAASAVLGERNHRRDAAKLAGGAFFLFFAGYAVVRGVQMLLAYLDRTIGEPGGGVLFFLELIVFDAPVVGLFLLGVAVAYATRRGAVLVSCALPALTLLGMGFAEFGFPPQLLNVFYQAVPAGIVLGALGWLLGVGTAKMHHANRTSLQ